jgi:formate dehydrogenase subunit gamma
MVNGRTLMTKLRETIKSFAEIEGGLMPALHAVQEMEGHISKNAISELAHVFNQSKAEVLDVLTYYDDFTLEPSGDHVIRVCRAEACQSLNSKELTDELTNHFGLSLGETTGDSRITLKEVFCLGNCALGPSVMIDESVIGEADKDKVLNFLKDIE